MQEFTITETKAFAETMEELYRAFFKSFPYLKPLIFKALFYDNGNYGLVIKENNLVKAKYTIYKCSTGFIVKSGIKDLIGLKFQVEAAAAWDLMKNRKLYVQKPHKLLKHLFRLLKSMSVADKGLYAHMLEGSKVILRPFEDSDMPYLLNWYNDYELNKLAGWSSEKITASKLKYNMTRSFGCDPLNLMIDDLNGKPIGTIQLYDFNEKDKSCRLGIRIGDRDYWSKGYGGDAVNTIAEYAFSSLGMFRIDLRVYEYNTRAARCYEKCGFKQEGRSRKSAYIDGEYYDEIIMGLLKSDFLKNKNSNNEDLG